MSGTTTDHASMKWIIDDCDSTDETPSFAYIEFHCPKCEAGFGLEQGQYGWSMGDEIPYRYCPMCGARLHTYVVEFLNNKGFKIDAETLDNLIEAAVFDLPDYFTISGIPADTDSNKG